MLVSVAIVNAECSECPVAPAALSLWAIWPHRRPCLLLGRPMWGSEHSEGVCNAVAFADHKEIVLEVKDSDKTTKKCFEFDHGQLHVPYMLPP